MSARIAVIPARGGSKRIPRKNIRPFCGRPILAWTVEAAVASGLFAEVVVSTDDDEIAAVAESMGATAPFRRPADLSNDEAATLPVIAHAITDYEARKTSVESACCLYATAPFLQAARLIEGAEILGRRPDADFVFSAASYAYPIFRGFGLGDDGRVAMFWPENESRRSQDLPSAYHDAGQFYWGRRNAFFEQRGVFSARSYPVMLPRHEVQDIDTLEDWEFAERLFLAGRS